MGFTDEDLKRLKAELKDDPDKHLYPARYKGPGGLGTFGCCEFCKHQLELLEALEIAWEALDKATCSTADIATSKDFDRGNTGKYVSSIYSGLKDAMRRIEKLGMR